MKKLIYMSVVLCSIHNVFSAQKTPITTEWLAPKNFTILQKTSDFSASKNPTVYIFITSGIADTTQPSPDKLYASFMSSSNIQKPNAFLYFDWKDTAGKQNLIINGDIFFNGIVAIKERFQGCEFIITTQGRAGLLVNYVSNNRINTLSSSKECPQLKTLIQLGTPLPDDPKDTAFLHPNLSKIGTLFFFYTQAAFATSSSDFPSSPKSFFLPDYVAQNKNVYCVRLLMQGIQTSFVSIFNSATLLPLLGANLFTLCSSLEASYKDSRRFLWASIGSPKDKDAVLYAGALPPDKDIINSTLQNLASFINKSGRTDNIELKPGPKLRNQYNQ